MWVGGVGGWGGVGARAICWGGAKVPGAVGPKTGLRWKSSFFHHTFLGKWIPSRKSLILFARSSENQNLISGGSRALLLDDLLGPDS